MVILNFVIQLVEMEHFVVSARKYRPQSFKDVVGQQAITNTLINAIENNHLAQAFLFCEILVFSKLFNWEIVGP